MESENYVWKTSKTLGHGATSVVYMGKKKRTGEEVAVKVFTYMDTKPGLQEREFGVQKLLSHKNVVQFIAVETELHTTAPVLIMEYCSEGTLHELLLKPQNAFGLQEEEFLNVLKHITDGMKHLRDHGIVHRDIKPGNVMCCKAANGRYIYKLTDFGAARKLNDVEDFKSLYGTEEYLHPDIYDEAIMHQRSNQQFEVTVDLWSLGVTFYQAATSQLPFEPFGGRKNRETMHKILSEKKSGILSGVQKEERGSIQWDRDLPETCCLSLGLKNHLVPFLARLLERDPRKTWKFDTYFRKVEEILSKEVLHVFWPDACQSFKIYTDKNQSFTLIQELIAIQTEVDASSQLLLFEGQPLAEIIDSVKVQTYPKCITAKHPVFLFTMENVKVAHIQNFIPHYRINANYEDGLIDKSVLEQCEKVSYQVKRTVHELVNKQKLIYEAQRNFSTYISHLFHHHQDLALCYRWLYIMQQQLSQLLAIVFSTNRGDADRVFAAGGRNTEVGATASLRKLLELNRNQNDLLHNEIISKLDKFNDWQWKSITISSTCQEDECSSNITTLVADIHAAIKRLKKNLLDPIVKDQFQLLDRNHLVEYVKRTESLLMDHCYPNSKRIYDDYQGWFKMANEVWKVTRDVFSNLKKFNDNSENFHELRKQIMVGGSHSRDKMRPEHRLTKQIRDNGLPLSLASNETFFVDTSPVLNNRLKEILQRIQQNTAMIQTLIDMSSSRET